MSCGTTRRRKKNDHPQRAEVLRPEHPVRARELEQVWHPGHPQRPGVAANPPKLDGELEITIRIGASGSDRARQLNR